MMLTAKLEGPTRRAKARQWPLDGVFVGVGAVRVMRELYRRRHRECPVRAWDLALWCGVTPFGATKVLRRLAEIGLVERVHPPAPTAAATWRLVPGHPLHEPIQRLFAAERATALRVTRRTTAGRLDM